MRVGYFSLLAILICLGGCETTTAQQAKPVSAKEIAVLNNIPPASGRENLCAINVGKEPVAITSMKNHPQSYFGTSCSITMQGWFCRPVDTSREWPQRVRAKLKAQGCNDTIIAEKMPEILATHCRIGLYKGC